MTHARIIKAKIAEAVDTDATEADDEAEAAALALEKIRRIETQINARFAERRREIRSLLISAVAGEHVLMLGPPGTAKTELVKAVSDAMFGTGEFFSVLCTKFSTLDDFYGPVDLERYTKGVNARIIKGRAWDSKAVFVDEVFKGSSAILNSMLKLMAERKADNDGERPVPLQMLVGCSNEYPESKQLDALFDRFGFKFWVDYMSDPQSLKRVLMDRAKGRFGMTELWETGEATPNMVSGARSQATEALGENDLGFIRSLVAAVQWRCGDAETLLEIKAAVEREGFRPSDRKWVQVPKLVLTSAALDGRTRINASDWRILADVLWTEHKDRPRLLACIGNAADPYGARAEAITDGVRVAMRELPDFSLLVSGARRKSEMVAEIAKVSKQVMAEFDKARDLNDEASDNATVTETIASVEAAIKQIDELNNKVVFYRETKKV